MSGDPTSPKSSLSSSSSSSTPTSVPSAVSTLSSTQSSLRSSALPQQQVQVQSASTMSSQSAELQQPQQAAASQAQAGTGGGVVDFPLPGTKGAPKKFKGKHSDVLPFLHFYERLCRKHNVTSDTEKVENITQYCSSSVRRFMEGLPSYQTPDWAAFVRDLKKYYEADKEDKRFIIRDLEKFARHSRTRPLRTMKAWTKYMRDFIRIGGWLRKNGRLSDYDYKFYFWIGLPETLRNQLEARLVAQLPHHDMSDPFDVDDVVNAAESLLHRRRFDRDRLLSEPETEDSDLATTTSTEDSDSDHDSDSSEEERSRRKKKKLRKVSKEVSRECVTKSKPKQVKKTTKRIVKFQKPAVEDIEDSDMDAPPPRMTQRSMTPSREQSKDDLEVEELIRQLEKMDLSDPDYAVAYFRACNRHPLVKQIVAPPVDRRRVASQSSVQAHPAVPRTRNFERDTPPHVVGGSQKFPAKV